MVRLFQYLIICWLLLPAVWQIQAEEALLDQRWYRLQSTHFVLISEVSSRQTRRFAEQLEVWRQLASRIIASSDSLPPANVPIMVFLFAAPGSLQHFSMAAELAFFQATPRANYMALVAGDAVAERAALHHYGHFLQRNFADLRLPRWYEEGISGYLAQLQIVGKGARFHQADATLYQTLRSLSETLSMERLLYRDESLASPRRLQIANLKSEWLIHYLHHGWETDWPDRRQQLQRYLQLIRQGRTTRYAFDQAFDVTTAELDDELHGFLSRSAPLAAEFPFRASQSPAPGEPQRLSRAALALELGELALNAGQAAQAEQFFAAAMAADPTRARAFSGLGDALRFQAVTDRDQEIANYFDQALALAPDDPAILLDHGEYWEAELTDCDKIYSAGERLVIIDRIRQSLRQALVAAPDSAEANLAMGQVYLLPEQSWRDGLTYQQQAFTLLPADSFVMEQAARYAIAAGAFAEAEMLIAKLAQPFHAFGVPDYVNALRRRLQHKINNEEYKPCAEP